LKSDLWIGREQFQAFGRVDPGFDHVIFSLPLGAGVSLWRGQDAYLTVKGGVAANRHRGRIFISKAVILLCLAKKSRDADHLQNFVYDQMAGLDEETLSQDLREADDYVPIPGYAYDCHTREGRKSAARPRRTSSRPSRPPWSRSSRASSMTWCEGRFQSTSMPTCCHRGKWWM
jgi:hypothetical protein